MVKVAKRNDYSGPIILVSLDFHTIDLAKPYGRITLINIFAKIYSQLLLCRLTKWSDKYEKLCKHQFVFQKGKSIVDCLFILQAAICKTINSGDKLFAAFVMNVVVIQLREIIHGLSLSQ